MLVKMPLCTGLGGNQLKCAFWVPSGWKSCGFRMKFREVLEPLAYNLYLSQSAVSLCLFKLTYTCKIPSTCAAFLTSKPYT